MTSHPLSSASGGVGGASTGAKTKKHIDINLRAAPLQELDDHPLSHVSRMATASSNTAVNRKNKMHNHSSSGRKNSANSNSRNTKHTANKKNNPPTNKSNPASSSTSTTTTRKMHTTTANTMHSNNNNNNNNNSNSNLDMNPENVAQILDFEANNKNSNCVPLKESIFERPLNSKRYETVSLSAFSHLFCELIRYSQTRIRNVTQLEQRLAEIGFNIGTKQLELMSYRASPGKRHRDVIGMLEFIKTHVWKQLFGKVADDFQQSTSNDMEFFIVDENPLTNKYVSVPESLGDFNPASLIAGIIHGILHNSGFPCKVYAYDPPPTKQNPKIRTVYIIEILPKMRFGGVVK